MERSDLEAALRQRSWEWLIDAASRLGVVAELVDDRLTPLLPAGTVPGGAELRQRLSTGDQVIRAAISAAGRSPAAFVLDGLDAIALRSLGPTALIVAQPIEAGDSAAARRDALHRVGRWLTAAIEETLSEPPDSLGGEAFPIRALRHLLTDAAARGSVRKLGGAFVEAVGVWNAVRVRIYAAGTNGRLFDYISPVAGPRYPAPAELDHRVVADDKRLVRLERGDAARLGFGSEPGDVFLLRLRTNDLGWLLVFSGAIDDAEQVRLTIYSDIFRELLVETLAAQTRRLVDDMTAHELPPDESLPAAVETALHRVAAAVQGSRAGLVFESGGTQRLAAGDSSLAANAGHGDAHRVAHTGQYGESTVTLAVSREDSPFAGFERSLVEAGSAVLQSRLHAIIQQRPGPERRRRFRALPEMFDELAGEAVREGQPVSFIVLSAVRALPQPALMTCLGRIRGEVRPGDHAAILNDREIGVLLRGVSPEGAAVVSERLQRVEMPADVAGQTIRHTIGISTSSPDTPHKGSIVAAARLDAAFAR